MDRLKRVAIVISLIGKMDANDSWCGETHIQKSTFFLEKALRVPLDFDFILYKHGPYSFDLSDEIMSSIADGYIDIRTRYPMGSSIIPSEMGYKLQKRHSEHVDRYVNELDFVSKEIATLNVVNLECLSTALYVTLNSDTIEVIKRATTINQLKPHISIDKAIFFVNKVDEVMSKIKSILNPEFGLNLYQSII